MFASAWTNPKVRYSLISIGILAITVTILMIFQTDHDESWKSISSPNNAGERNFGLILACVLIPLIEEFVFRRVLLLNIIDWFGRPVAMNVLVALAFGLAHSHGGSWGFIFIRFIETSITGYVFGLAILSRRNFWDAAVCHMAVNMAGVIPALFIASLLNA